MANIQNELNNIKNAVFGKDVRDSIHDAIKTCYDDASVNDNANMEVKLARGVYKTLNERLNESDKKQEEISSQLEHIENKLETQIYLHDFKLESDEDYTNAFISAINYIKSKNGGTLYIKENTDGYKIKPDKIAICNNINIIGIGNPKIFTSFEDTYLKMFTGEVNVSNVLIKNITFDQFSNLGDYDISRNTKIFELHSLSGLFLVENCTFNMIGVHAIYVWSRDEKANVILRDNEINYKMIHDKEKKYDASAIYIETNEHQIYNNIIRNLTPDTYKLPTLPGGIESHGNGGSVYNNKIYGLAGGVGIGINIVGVDDVEYSDAEGSKKVYNNKIHNCQSGIILWSCHEDYYIQNIDIFNNDIFMGFYEPMKIDSIVTGTILIGIGKIYSQKGKVKNVNIHSNNIQFNGVITNKTGWVYEAFNSHMVGGITLCDSENCNISNNNIKNLCFPAICITSTNDIINKNITLSNNIIEDCYVKHPYDVKQIGVLEKCILSLNKASYVNIEHNKIYINDSLIDDDTLVGLTLIGLSRENNNIKFVGIGNEKIQYINTWEYLEISKPSWSFDNLVSLRHFSNPNPLLKCKGDTIVDTYFKNDNIIDVVNKNITTVSVGGTIKKLENVTCSLILKSSLNDVMLITVNDANTIEIGEVLNVNGKSGIVVSKIGNRILVINKNFQFSSFEGDIELSYMSPQ